MGEVIAGIDYGSKTSGFTCVAFLVNNRVRLQQAAKNKDADQWLKGVLSRHSPALVGIDAPLSLPGVLTGLAGFSNYHFRLADLEARAMSPMFLGGLTARAIQLSRWYASEKDAQVIEVYPKLAAGDINLDFTRYKKDNMYLAQALGALCENARWSTEHLQLSNWHQFDALLALYSTQRYAENKAKTLGEKAEGLIYF